MFVEKKINKRKEVLKLYHPNLFKAKLAEKNYSISQLAMKIGLSYYGLSLKVNGKREFKVSEINKISKILALDIQSRDSIFFSKS